MLGHSNEKRKEYSHVKSSAFPRKRNPWKENSQDQEKCRKGLLGKDPSCLGNEDAPSLCSCMPSPGTSLSTVLLLLLLHISPPSLIAADLQYRFCHSVWVQPQTPKPTFPNPSWICLLSPLRLLNWQGNTWTLHSWMIPHSGQGKGRLFPWPKYFNQFREKYHMK